MTGLCCGAGEEKGRDCPRLFSSFLSFSFRGSLPLPFSVARSRLSSPSSVIMDVEGSSLAQQSQSEAAAAVTAAGAAGTETDQTWCSCAQEDRAPIDQAAVTPPFSSLLLPTARPLTIECDVCRTDISNQVRIKCAVCEDYDTCLDCFYRVQFSPALKKKKKSGSKKSSKGSLAKDAERHDPSHGYRVCDAVNFPLFTANWSIGEELLLLEGARIISLYICIGFFYNCALSLWLRFASWRRLTFCLLHFKHQAHDCCYTLLLILILILILILTPPSFYFRDAPPK